MKPTAIIANTPTVGPFAWALFASAHPDEAAIGDVGEVKLSQDLLTLLDTVNREVNAAIRPRNDKGDVWSLAPAEGDCEDYSLTKRHHLRLAGVPIGALRLCFVRTSWGEPHCVLVCRTDQGDYVLDNLRPDVCRWDRCRHGFMMMATENPAIWVK